MVTQPLLSSGVQPVHVLPGKIFFPSPGSTVRFLLAPHCSPLSCASSRKGGRVSPQGWGRKEHLCPSCSCDRSPSTILAPVVMPLLIFSLFFATLIFSFFFCRGNKILQPVSPMSCTCKSLRMWLLSLSIV